MKRKIIFRLTILFAIFATCIFGYMISKDGNKDKCSNIPTSNAVDMCLDIQIQKSVPTSGRLFTSEELLVMMKKGAQGDLTNEQFDSVLVEAQTGMKYHDYRQLSEEDRAKINEITGK